MLLVMQLWVHRRNLGNRYYQLWPKHSRSYYDTPGTITNKDNTLKSNSGRYYVKQKKFQFTAVTITNPTVIKSNHLDYFSNSGHSYLLWPQRLPVANYIYTEKDFMIPKKIPYSQPSSMFIEWLRVTVCIMIETENLHRQLEM
jgi:hypothetical protein